MLGSEREHLLLRVALTLVALGLSADPASANTAFWRPYQPDRHTYTLWHLDGDAQDAVAAADAAERHGATSFGTGRFGRGLVFESADGVLVARPASPPPEGSFAVEAWVLARELPAAEHAVVAELVEADGVPRFSLGVTSKGAARFAWRGLGGHPLLESPPGAVRAGRWTHLAGAVAALSWNGRGALFVDGNQVAGLPVQQAAWPRAASAGATLYLGNDGARRRPFVGTLDELRVQAGAFAYFPQPDHSWTDPRATQPLADAPPYLPGRARVLFHASFDGSTRADAGVAPEPLASDTVRFVSGVRGRALLGHVEFPAQGNLRSDRGALELWFRSDGWDNLHEFNVPLVAGPGVLYVFNRGVPDVPPAPLAFYVPEPRDERDFIGADVVLAPERWHHVVVNWRDSALRLFVDGVPRAQGEASAGLGAAPLALGFGRSAIDELYVYDRPLTAQEASNAFNRYRDPSRLRPASPLDLAVRDLPGLGRVVLRAELLAIERPGDVAEVCFTIRSGQRRLWQHAARRRFDGWVEGIAELPEPVAGTLTVVAEARDAAGAVLAAAEERFTRAAHAWLGSGIGEDDIVLPPWTPVVAGADRLETWGRRIHLGADGLPAQVESGGAGLLAAPIRLEGRVGDRPLKLTRSVLRWTLRSPTRAEYVAESAAGALNVRIEGRQEYDGLLALRLSFEPREPVQLGPLSLVIPLRSTEALEFYALGSRPFQFRAAEIAAADGGFWDSRDGGFFTRGARWHDPAALSRDSAMTSGSFIPYVWLGNGERGLAWMADNDRGWLPDPHVPAVVLERRGLQTLLRLNLLGRGLQLTEPRSLGFALMATPAKPLPAQARQWIYRAGAFGAPGLAVFEDAAAAGRAYADGAFLREPFPADWEKSARYAARIHAQGQRYMPYQELVSFTAREPELAAFAAEWQGVFPVDSLNDLRLFRMREWARRVGVDGSYVDNVYPRPCFDPALGSAYRLPDGRIQPGFHLFGLRSYLKRLRTLFHLEGREPPLLTVHMTHTLPIPALSFADIALGGEDQYVTGPGAQDFLARWRPLAALRIVSDGARWGLLSSFLAPTGGWNGADAPAAYAREWRSAMGGLLLHDVHLLPEVRDERAPQGPRQALTAWGIDAPGVLFHPYWRPAGAARCEPSGARASYWSQGARLMAIVTNFGERTEQVSLDLGAAPVVPRALVDAESGERLERAAAGFRVSVPARGFRLLRTPDP